MTADMNARQSERIKQAGQVGNQLIHGVGLNPIRPAGMTIAALVRGDHAATAAQPFKQRTPDHRVIGKAMQEQQRGPGSVVDELQVNAIGSDHPGFELGRRAMVANRRHVHSARSRSAECDPGRIDGMALGFSQHGCNGHARFRTRLQNFEDVAIGIAAKEHPSRSEGCGGV